MKTHFNRYVFFFLILAYMPSCNSYEDKEIESSICVNHTSLSLLVGDKVQLTASPTDGTYQFEWNSNDPSIVTVTSEGLVEALQEGYAEISVSGGSILTKVPVNIAKRIPLTDVILSDTQLDLLPNDKKTILVTYVPENANDLPAYSWTSNNEDVITINEVGQLTIIKEGQARIDYKIGEFARSVNVFVSYTMPFKGPHVLSVEEPYELMAFDFDLGGAGYAFNKPTPITWATNSKYRINNGDPNSANVFIEENAAGEVTNIAGIHAGDWLLYSIDVKDAGIYELQISVNSFSGTDGAFHVEVDGVLVSEPINIPPMNSWFLYEWMPAVPLQLNLSEGRHKVKFYSNKDGFNLKALKFTPIL